MRQAWTPQLRTDTGPTALVLVDLANGRTRLGGSILAQVYGEAGDEAPDVDDPGAIRGFFEAPAELRRAGRVLAYHDRSDGGLFITICEMSFAGHAGVSIDAGALCEDDRDLVAALFAEELGAVVQMREAEAGAVLDGLRGRGLAARGVVRVSADDEIRVMRGAEVLFAAPRISLQRAWSETTWQMQSLRDNPESARQEYDRILDAGDPGITPVVTFDPGADIAAPFIATSARPPIAILRDQGVNGEVEMAAAFDRAGFDAQDVHMSDVIDGRVSLATFRGLVACGGFSFGDVLGGGEGWAQALSPCQAGRFVCIARRHGTRDPRRGQQCCPAASGWCHGCHAHRYSADGHHA